MDSFNDKQRPRPPGQGGPFQSETGLFYNKLQVPGTGKRPVTWLHSIFYESIFLLSRPIPDAGNHWVSLPVPGGPFLNPFSFSRTLGGVPIEWVKNTVLLRVSSWSFVCLRGYLFLVVVSNRTGARGRAGGGPTPADPTGTAFAFLFSPCAPALPGSPGRSAPRPGAPGPPGERLSRGPPRRPPRCRRQSEG